MARLRSAVVMPRLRATKVSTSLADGGGFCGCFCIWSMEKFASFSLVDIGSTPHLQPAMKAENGNPTRTRHVFLDGPPCIIQLLFGLVSVISVWSLVLAKLPQEYPSRIIDAILYRKRGGYDTYLRERFTTHYRLSAQQTCRSSRGRCASPFYQRSQRQLLTSLRNSGRT